MAAHYPYGRKKELQVAELFIDKRYLTGRAQGSRGPFDLLVTKGNRRFAIQVKSNRPCKISTRCLSSVEEERLIQAARRERALPILALVSRNYAWFLIVPSGEIVGEKELKRLKRKYPNCT